MTGPGPGPGPGQRRWRLVRASTDAVPASVRRVFLAARQHGRLGRSRGGRRRVRLLGLVAAVTGLALLAGWVLWGTSLVGVREVRVTGTDILAAAEVRAAAAVAEQTPLLRVDAGGVADRVAALPPVAAVRVHRHWPHTLVIEVVERTAAAAVPSEEGFRLIDADGVGFQTTPEPPAGLPVLIVAELTAELPAGPGVEAGLTVLAALTPRLREELSTVTVAGPASIRLTLDSGRTVVWGDQHDSAEKARVATALLDRDGETIDVSALAVVGVR